MDGTTNEAAARAYAERAERRAAELDQLPAGTTPLDVGRVGIVGAGTMGGGIAMSFARAGIPVTLVERDDAALERGLATVRANLERSVRRGSATEHEAAERLDRITGTTEFDRLAEVDLAIEAVFEDLELKRELFGRLDRVAPDHAVLATNTSALDVDRIAEVTSRPQQVVGMHFASPANVMRMLEVVRGAATSPEAVATAVTVGTRIGKVPVVVGVCHGFVGNRLLFARGAEAERLLLEGATPDRVDRVLLDFGFPMGPFVMSDLAGVDVGWRADRSTGETVRDVLCEHDRRGQKNGRGYYRYDPADPRLPIPDPDVEPLIRQVAERRGVTRRDPDDTEILERLLFPLVNEGANVLEEGIARRGGDVDAIWLNGYAFPRDRGGPMYWADSLGLDHVVARIVEHGDRLGGRHWEPSPLLVRLATEGGALHLWPDGAP